MQSDLTTVLIQPDRAPHRRSPLAHGQRLLLTVLAAMTAVAWMLTIAHTSSTLTPNGTLLPGSAAHHLHRAGLDDAMHMAASGMAGAGWSLVGFATFVVAWAVMMAAMMFPGLAPMVLTIHAIGRYRQGARGALRSTAVFVSGYLLVWTAVGVLIWALVQVAGTLTVPLALGDRATWGPMVLGGALIVAGLYQFTLFKQVCLNHCRSPFIVVMQRWREGYAGALRMGIGHGLFCLGCCWALFMVLVAAGTMSLAWMLALTAIDAAEKTVSLGQQVSRGIGVTLVVLGIVLATRAFILPGV